MRIALVYNERPSSYDRNDPSLAKLTIEGDERKTIEAVGQAIESNGHNVSYFKVDADIYERLKASKSSINLVFNLAEGVSSGADREAHIPMLCEILGIPYTGPGPLSAALILNKSRAKEIWRANGVQTADSQLLFASSEPLKKSLTFPLIVKPSNEGSGIGIKSNSIVHNLSELRNAIKLILNNYHQPALVETYLPGREFTVALIGNGDNVITLPIVEINFAAFPDGAPPIDSYEAKFVYGATGMIDMHSTEFCPAVVTPKLEKEINKLAGAAYQTIGCLDFGRVDIRLDDKDVPHVLEINHPPGLMSDPDESSFFTIAGRAAGLTFPQTIGRILRSALTRLDMLR
jgi:D-alanine-D-alanine ligase